jgi:hypothetical protein
LVNPNETAPIFTTPPKVTELSGEGHVVELLMGD